MIIYVDRPVAPEESTEVRDAVRAFFSHRANSTRQRLHQLLRIGRTSLLVGFMLLAASIGFGTLVSTTLSEWPIAEILRESLVIGGWVAMWRPLETFLYDWWPIRGEAALTHALGHALQEQGTPPSPAAALALVNGALAARYLMNSGQFVTAFAGWYETRTQVLKYASAGHPPPRLIRGNEVRRLDRATGIPLGVESESFYQEAAVQLCPGDRLVLFTDGMTEGTNATGEQFGDQRLDEVLCAPTNKAAEYLERIVNSVQAFRADLPSSDDETCLVVVVKPIAPSQQSESEVVRC